MHSHCSIPVLACSTAFVLFGHEKQRAAPPSGWYCAAEHASHDATSPPFANVPTSHGMQCVCPGCGWKPPAGHVVQYGAPDAFE